MTRVGQLKRITIEAKSDEQLGKDVLDLLESYSALSTSVRSFFAEVPAVTVIIQPHGGSGAEVKHRTGKIIVDESLPGGADEIAESTLFELCNWVQGDFAGQIKDEVVNGGLTPFQGGVKIAEHEAQSSFRHGQLLQDLKGKGFIFSAYGERQRKKTSNQTLDDIESNIMLTPHKRGAPSTDLHSLATPFLYWYQLINDNANADITIRGIINPEEWLKECISRAWTFHDMYRGAATNPDPSSLYVKLINLAKLDDRHGIQTGRVRAGYEFTHAMKVIAHEKTPIPDPLKRSLKAIPGDSGMPTDLTERFKTACLLS